MTIWRHRGSRRYTSDDRFRLRMHSLLAPGMEKIAAQAVTVVGSGVTSSEQVSHHEKYCREAHDERCSYRSAGSVAILVPGHGCAFWRTVSQFEVSASYVLWP